LLYSRSLISSDLPTLIPNCDAALDKVILGLDGETKLLAIDEQANHNIVHQLQLRKADRLPGSVPDMEFNVVEPHIWNTT
jgi:hypothetical protein